MPKLAILVRNLMQFSINPGISDERFLNAFLSALVVAGNVRNKRNEELYFDKTATSLLLNQKVDVHQKLRKSLQKYGIKTKTEAGMSDFVEDYINPASITELKLNLRTMIENDSFVGIEERNKLIAKIDGNISALLADLLILSLSEDNRAEPNRKIVWKSGTGAVEVIFGNLFQFGFENRKKSHKNIVVIPVNTAFDTHITRKLEGSPKPIVSENTIHGQWLRRMEQSGANMKQLDIRIADSLRCLGFQQLGTDSNRNGKEAQYGIGACAVIETENADYFLLAISKFDEQNSARSTALDIMCATTSLLQVYDRIGQGYDLYLPMMGTGRSRAGMSIAESYQLLKKCMMNNKQLIHGHIYLVIRPEDSCDVLKEEL